MAVCACGAEVEDGAEADVANLGEAGGGIGAGYEGYEGFLFVLGGVAVDLGALAGVEEESLGLITYPQ